MGLIEIPREGSIPLSTLQGTPETWHGNFIKISTIVSIFLLLRPDRLFAG
jgi:hypothetical protein